MNWPLAIERHRLALLGIVASMIALLGGRDAAGPVTRGLRRAAVALLRPAESAARRLIVIAARGLVLAPSPSRPPPAGLGPQRRGPGKRAFRLHDPAQRFRRRRLVVVARGVPRIRSFWASPLPSPPPPPAPPAPRPDPAAPVEADSLRLRLTLLEAALTDLPRQARRLARRRARAARAPAGRPPRSPLRLGRPPGWRQRPTREVDHLLRESHALAMEALRVDTS
jgi:hypothetical protein